MRFDVANRKKIQPYKSEGETRAYQTQKVSTIPKRGGDTDAELMTFAAVGKQRRKEFSRQAKQLSGRNLLPEQAPCNGSQDTRILVRYGYSQIHVFARREQHGNKEEKQ